MSEPLADMRIDALRRARNDALGTAMERRAGSAHDAEVEYSETVAKLAERFEADRAEALRHYLARVTPAHRAYNAAVVRAERRFAEER